MERFVFYIIGLFVMVVIFASTTSPASVNPLHNSSIEIEIGSLRLANALALLDRYPEYKEYVEERIYIIRSGRLTRIVAGERGTVEITDHFLESQTIPWLASMLVHEARHVEQFRTGQIMTDQEHELDANKTQATALYFMGGNVLLVDQLLSQDGLHFDTNGNGILDKGDDWGW